MNLYGYTGNDPVNNFDPTGKCTDDVLDSTDTDAVTLIKGICAGTINLAEGTAKTLANDAVDLAESFFNSSPFSKGAEIDFSDLKLSFDNSIEEDGGEVGAALVEIGSVAGAGKQLAKSGLRAIAKGGCCFVAGTPVLTQNGSKNIEDIKVGDKVLSRDPLTGEQGFKAVTAFIPKHNRQIWKVTVANEEGKIETYETTDEHPWWIVGEGWVRTDELKVAMRGEDSRRKLLTVKSVSKTNRFEGTYNLTVADFHTYFVGEFTILVHNCFPPVTKAVNTKLPHAIERGVERGVFSDSAEAGSVLRNLTRQIGNRGFPSGTIQDSANGVARANSFLLPVGNGGVAVYRVNQRGVASLRYVLNRR